ncbi:hypothetical protein K505DRAFT_367651 [Melanomma pulvis-pyrius CBS 109.77]|uniref:Knr4/Smi1-like domain-containing protein n=1 Tax=Melanomma pulvis-pyrius CBS 109.77 TaxID=1314802 RepID=A0A6A6WT93_9PLEO|nr:hypothetical protein K505DRAFT_367651 [Melanomma pulvis-pyrius CBS 109.77]
MTVLLPWSPFLAERCSHNVINGALTRALDLMILGFVDEGTKIANTLYDYNALQFENETDMVIGMYCAWSKSWPTFIKSPDPSKPTPKRSRFPPDEGDVDSSLKRWISGSEHSKLDLDIKALAEQFRKGDKKRHLIAHSSEAWKQLREKKLAEELEIKDVNHYIKEGIKTLQQRFTTGPTALDKSIPELVKFMRENYVAARAADPSEDNGDEAAPSYLMSPASDDDIQELQERIGFTLPDDYKEFLRVSNGFSENDDLLDMDGIFYGSSCVDWDDSIEDTEQGIELLPYSYTAIDLMDTFEWPKAQAISLGAGGDEGNIWLFEPRNVKKALEAFERGYKNAPEKDKRVFERGAIDLYGGLEEMRKLDWVVITWYHWAPDPEPYKAFTGYLKYAARYAQGRKEEASEEANGEKRKRGDDGYGSGDGGQDAEEAEGEDEEEEDGEGQGKPVAKQPRSS